MPTVIRVFSPDRAVAQTLKNGESATVLRGIIGPNGAIPIYRGVNGLKPAIWPHIVFWKLPGGVRYAPGGTPRLLRDTMRVCVVMRSDQLNGRAMIEDVLEPIHAAILSDLCEATVCTLANGGKAWRSHIVEPRFELQQPLGGEVEAHQLGVEARFLSK